MVEIGAVPLLARKVKIRPAGDFQSLFLRNSLRAPRREGLASMSQVTLLFSLLCLQFFYAAGANIWQLLVFSIGQCGLCALRPVFRRVPHSAALAHSFADALGVSPGAFLAVVADEDRLSKGDVFHDGIHLFAGVLGVLSPVLAVIFKAFGPFLGSLGKGFVFVADLAAKLHEQVGTLWRPHGRDEKLLSGCP